MSVHTTVRLDEDVFERLERECKSSGKPIDETVNRVLRTALMRRQESKAERFRIVPLPIKLRTDLNYDKVEELLASTEEHPRP